MGVGRLSVKTTRDHVTGLLNNQSPENELLVHCTKCENLYRTWKWPVDQCIPVLNEEHVIGRLSGSCFLAPYWFEMGKGNLSYLRTCDGLERSFRVLVYSDFRCFALNSSLIFGNVATNLKLIHAVLVNQYTVNSFHRRCVGSNRQVKTVSTIEQEQMMADFARKVPPFGLQRRLTRNLLFWFALLI